MKFWINTLGIMTCETWKTGKAIRVIRPLFADPVTYYYHSQISYSSGESVPNKLRGYDAFKGN